MTKILIGGAAWCAALFFLITRAAVAQETNPIVSPRLAALAAQLESGNTSALEQFWSRLQAEGGPIIEEIPGDANHVLISAIYRGNDTTRNVVLMGDLISGPINNRMLRPMLGTDLWFKTTRRRTDLRSRYFFSVNDPRILAAPLSAAEQEAAGPRMQPDRFNPNLSQYGNLITLPDAPDQPWIVENADNPKGNLTIKEGFRSKALNNERQIAIYTPPGYRPDAEPYSLLVVFDMAEYIEDVQTPRILDNLNAAGKIPPTIAVFVSNLPDRRTAELVCNPDFAAFVATELIPWVRDNYNVSTDPRKAVITGSSDGGTAATYIAFNHPEIFGNVLSQSASYFWGPGREWEDPDPESEGDWLARQFIASGKKPIRFYIDTGMNEPIEPVLGIRHFRNVLQAKGYEIVKYTEYNAGHTYLNWRGGLAEGLIALSGDAPRTR